MSAASIEGVGVSLSVLRPYAAHCIKLVCMAVVQQKEASSKNDATRKPANSLLKTSRLGYGLLEPCSCWSDETKIKLIGSDGVKVCCGNQVRSTKTSVSCVQKSMVLGVSCSGAA